MNIYTDQEFTYRQVPVSYDGIAKLDSIKGNTVAWNQQCDPTTYFSTLFRATKSISGTTVTVTDNRTSANASFGGATPVGLIPIGHKVFVSFNFKSYSISNFRYLLVYGRSSDGYSATEQKQITATGTQQMILTPSSYSMSTIAFNANTQTAVTGSTDNFVLENLMVIDLTQAFGTGNEPTIEEFTSIYSLPFYSYNSGTLVNFSGNAIKTVGFNQWDEEWEVGTINAQGQPVGDMNNIRSKNFNDILPNTTYYCVCPTSLLVYFYDGGQTFISGAIDVKNRTFTTPSNARYLKLRTGGYGGMYNNDICVNISSSRNGEYEPYTETITDLPISTYFPTGLKSAGDVYDELTPSKAVTRIGTVDLGSLNWTNDVANRYYSTGIANVIKRPNNVISEYAEGLTCAIYTPSPSPIGDKSQMQTIAKYINGNIYVLDDRYSNDATAFKTAMSGVMLNFELSNETEQDINADLFYKFYGDGTEEILPTNGTTPTTSAFFGDITYYNAYESEVPYRKFWMVNSKGERWNLTEREVRSFLNNPQGLGFSKTISTTRYGNAQVLTDITDNFPSPSGEVLFYDSHNSTRYEQYNEFVKFISHEPVTLYYKLPFSFYSQIPNVYTLECVVGTLTKTESKNDNLMTCPITFNALSYYQGEEVDITGTGTSYTITNDGDFPVGFEITIEGSLTNPYFTLEQGEELYGEAKFDDTAAFNSVYVNSNDGEQDVILQQEGAAVPNPLSYQDLSISNGSIYVTFVKLARGESTLTINMDSGSITGTTISFTPMYRSV